MEASVDLLKAFPALAEALPGGCLIYRADETERILCCNTEVLKIFGCGSEQEFKILTCGVFRGMVHPDDVERVEESIAAQIMAGDLEDKRDYVEYRIIRQDGTIRMVSDYGRLVHTYDGDLFVVFLTDVTDTVTRSLTRFEDNFMKILKVNITDDTFVVLKSTVEDEGQVSRFSSWVRQVGETGRVHEEDVDSYFAYTNHYYLREYFRRFDKPWRLRYRRRLGNEYSRVMMEMVRAQEYTDSNQVILLYVQVVDDEFSELGSHERKQNATMRLFSAAAVNMFPLGIVLNLSRNRYDLVRCNEYIRTDLPISGTVDELVEKALENIPDTAGKMDFRTTLSRVSMLDAFYSGLRQLTLRHKLLDNKNNLHWIETEVYFVDGLDEDVRAVATARCIDEEMAALDKIRQARRQAELANRAKETFLFNMSHDIRTPLNAILGLAELSEHQAENAERVRHYMGELKNAGSLLLGIMENILDFARIASGGAELEESPVNVQNTVELIKLSMLDNIVDKQLEIEVEEKVDRPMIYCDKDKIRVIYLNLLNNAVKYTHNGGHVRVLIEQLPSDKPGCCVMQGVVEDNGIGMTESFRRHVFEPFTRAASSTVCGVQGSGLGMSLVKSLVELMGGSVEVESKPGKGTKVTIRTEHRLVSAEDIAAQRSLREMDSEVLRGKRLLLAEDNDVNAEITIGLLEEAGIGVDRAVDGVECVSMLKNAEAGYYDLVLMDVQMPNLDGLRAAELIRALQLPCSRIPIVALTANAFEEDKEKAKKAGMNEHVAKPLDVRELFGVLLKYLS